MAKCEAMKALEALTPGGSEFVEDVERCVQFIRQTRENQVRIIRTLARRYREHVARCSVSPTTPAGRP